MTAIDRPPRDSISPTQGALAARPQSDLALTVADLLERVREELTYNAAKGTGPYRQGMHDGLRFAEEALVAIMEQCAGGIAVPELAPEASQMDVGPDYFGSNFWLNRQPPQGMQHE